MANNCVYIGGFKNDMANGPEEQFLMPGMPIFKGKFTNNKSSLMGFLLYNNGSIYLG